MSIKTRGFGFPINTSGSFPFFTKQQDERMIKNNVLHNILTVPGERVHRPTFGTMVSSLVFKSVLTGAAADVEDEIRSEVSKNDPRVFVKSVVITDGPNNNTLIVNVTVSPVQSPEENIEVRRLIRRLADSNQ